MGFLDNIKSKFGGGAANLDKIKDQAAGMKGQVDGLVDQYGDKLPDSVKNSYEAVSDKVESVLPDAAEDATNEGIDAPGVPGQPGQPGQVTDHAQGAADRATDAAQGNNGLPH